jgi:hypothetical protein
MRFTSRMIALGLVLLATSAARERSTSAARIDATPILPLKKIIDGVLVLEHDASAFDRAAQWVIEETPITLIKGEDLREPYEFYYGIPGAILSDGGVVVWGSPKGLLLVFDRTGRPVNAFAREGRGPKEIASARSFHLMAGDTLLVLDAGNSRVSWAVPTKGIIKTKKWEPKNPKQRGPSWLPEAHMTLVLPAGVLRDGRIVSYAEGRLQDATANRITRPPVDLLALDLRRSEAQDIVSLPDLELVLRQHRIQGKEGTKSDVLGFTRRAHALVWDTVIATGVGEGYTIDLRRSDGKILSRLQVRRPRIPVDDKLRNAYIADMLQRYGEMAIDKEENKRLIRTTVFADSLPPYDAMFLSSDKTLWVVDGKTTLNSGWNATAFRQDGAILGRLRVTKGSLPVAFSSDRVLLRQVDEDGNVNLSVHRIVPKS